MKGTEVAYKYDLNYKRTYTSYSSASPNIIRYIYDTKAKSFRHVQLSTPYRGELEIAVFGRDWIVNHFTESSAISLPYRLYIDKFGTYRKTYRSQTGVYIMPLFLPTHLANKRSAVIPVTLGPFGSSMADVLGGLDFISELDKGCEMVIDGRTIFVCSFPVCFVGDMPQQAELAGCMSHQATRGCRLCKIDKKNRH